MQNYSKQNRHKGARRELQFEPLEDRRVLAVQFTGGPTLDHTEIELGSTLIRTLKAVDIDGDSDQDIVATSQYSDKIAWHENDGRGNFSENVITESAAAVRRTQLLDYDNDGDIDVLAISASEYTVWWFENDGEGSFTEHAIVSLDGRGLIEFKVVDFDQDQDLDIIVGSFWDQAVYLHERDGDSFRQHTLLNSPGELRKLTTLDMDADGDLDLVTNNNVWRNDGEMQFQLHREIDSQREPERVEAVDFNQDGITDILVDKRIHLNDGDGNFSVQEIVHDAFVFADLDADGDEDLISINVNRIYWHENRGDGQDTLHLIGYQFADSISVFDIDNDGTLDIVTSLDLTNTIHGFSIASEIHAPLAIDAPSPFDPRTADLDGDGDDDLIVREASGVAWYERTNDGSLEHHTIFDGRVSDITIVDFNSDGMLDVLSPTVWLENKGDDGFESHVIKAHEASAIAAADLDGDGDKDIILGSNAIYWYENDGDGNLIERALSPAHPSNRTISSLFSADFDSDGDLDLISFSGYLRKVYFHENRGDGTFRDHDDHFDSVAVGTPVSVVDFDDDGDPDLISTRRSPNDFWRTGYILLFRNDGSANFTETPLTTIGAVGRIQVVDAGNDGDFDFVVHATYGDDTWYENLRGSWSPTTFAGRGYGSITPLDVDGDGLLDIVAATSYPYGSGRSQITWLRQERSATTFATDLDGDKLVTCQDSHLLRTAIRDNEVNSVFDLNQDGRLDGADLDTWQSLAAEQRGFSGSYSPADIDLDGNVDAYEFNVLGLFWTQQTDNGLCHGDVNGDGIVDAIDLNLVGRSWQMPLELRSDHQPRQAAKNGFRRNGTIAIENEKSQQPEFEGTLGRDHSAVPAVGIPAVDIPAVDIPAAKPHVRSTLMRRLGNSAHGVKDAYFHELGHRSLPNPTSRLTAIAVSDRFPTERIHSAKS